MTPQEYRDKAAEEYCVGKPVGFMREVYKAGFDEGRKFTYTKDERIRELVEQFDKECKREVRQQTIDGVLMLGTKHSDDCPKCKALTAYQSEKEEMEGL